MLELRPVCENCSKKLPGESTEAMICTFECTFCADCVYHILHNVCPNCGGGFENRPISPKEKLMKYPAKAEAYIKPVNMENFKPLLERNRKIKPAER